MQKFILFLFIVGALAATPYFIGDHLESQLRGQVQRFDDTPFYVVRVKSYEREYLRSHVIVELAVDDEFFEQEVFDDIPDGLDVTRLEEGSFDLHVNIQHGPILFEHGLDFGWADFSGVIDRQTYPKWKDFFKAVGKDKFYSWSAQVRFDGSGWVKSDMPDHDISYEKDGEQIRLVIDGYKDDLSFSSFGQTVVSEYSIDKFGFAMGSAEDSSGVLQFDLDLEKVRGEVDFSFLGSLWFGIGSGQISVEKLLGSFATDLDSSGIEVDDLYLYANISEGASPDTFTLRESVQIDSGNFNGYVADDLEFTFSYQNITKALLEAQITEPTLFQPDESGQLSEQAQARLEALLKDAMRRNPVVALEKMTFNSEDGSLDFRASAKLNSALLPSQIDFENPYLMLPALGAFADVDVSESLVKKIMIFNRKADAAALPEAERPTDEQIRQLVDTQISFGTSTLIQQGFLNFEDGKYSTQFSYDQGFATLNGKVIPLPGL